VKNKFFALIFTTLINFYNPLSGQNVSFNCKANNTSTIPVKTQKSNKTVSLQNSANTTWRTLPLPGGEVICIVRHPHHPEIAFAGTRDAGIFKTENYGEEWSASRQDLSFFPIRSMVILPHNPDILLAGTDFDGIWKSDDAGLSWEKTSYPGEFIVFNILVDPDNDSVIYAGEAGGIGLDLGHVYRSDDLGTTWHKIENGLPLISDGEYTNGIFSMAINPANGNVLYAGTNYSGIYRSTNNGDSWTLFNDSIPFLYGDSTYFPSVNAIAVCSQHPARPLALLDGKCYKFNGKFWQLIIDDYIGETIFPGVLYIDQSDSNKLFTNTHYSIDGGNTWEYYTDPGTTDRIGFSSLTKPTGSTLFLYAALTGYNGVVVSDDMGVTWKRNSEGINASVVYAVEIDDSIPSNIYSGANDYLVYSKNSGRVWDTSYFVWHMGGTYYDTVFDIGEVTDIETDHANPDIVYVAANDFYISYDGGKSLQILDSAGSPDFVKAVKQKNSHTVYIAGHGVRRSYDRGQTWTAINNGFPEELGGLIDIKSFCLDPSDTNTLWAGNWHFGGIWKTTDGGQNWISKGLDNDNYVSAIAVHPDNGSIVYAGTGMVEGFIYKSEDGGTTWKKKLEGIALPRQIAFDPRNPDQLYVATEGSGIYRSNDGGETWFSYAEGIFYPLHYSIDISNTDNPLLITGSYGSGMYYAFPDLCPKPAITVQPQDQRICSGSELVLSVELSGGYASCQWYKNDTILNSDTLSDLIVPNVLPSYSGYYKCLANNICGTVSSEQAFIYVNNFEVSVFKAGDSLFTRAGADSYQWLNCTTGEPVDAETNYFFMPLTNGTYQVIVQSGSCTDTSDCIVMDNPDGVNVSNAGSLKIFPNPAAGNVVISVPGKFGSHKNPRLEIISPTGTILIQKEISPDDITIEINLFSLQTGIYQVIVYSEDELYIQKLIKNE
jgi:photosystem II stability/assembly factor-like uncharacterized protein